MYASQWFMTIYSCNFPFEATVRIWDIFLVEGKKILFRIALALFKLNEKEMMNAGLEQLFGIVREF